VIVVPASSRASSAILMTDGRDDHEYTDGDPEEDGEDFHPGSGAAVIAFVGTRSRC
jgi:hypothetical protein